MTEDKHYSTGDKDQEFLVKLLIAYFHKRTGIAHAKAGRLFINIMTDIMKNNSVTYANTRLLPESKRKALFDECLEDFFTRTGIRENYHDKIRKDAYNIYSNWSKTIRIEPSSVDIELHTLIDELTDKGIFGKSRRL